MSRSKFIKGTLILTITGFIIRLLGFIYKIFLSRTIGATALGTFQLVLPVMAVCHAISVSGIEVTLSKTTSFYKADNKINKLIPNAVHCLSLSLLLGIGCGLVLNIFAVPLSVYFLNNSDCISLIRIFSLSIPLSCVHSMFYSYYIGTENAVFPSVSQLLEQLVRFASVFIFSLFTKGAILAVLSTLAGEGFSVILCLLLYFKKKRKYTGVLRKNICKGYAGIIKQAFPITINRLVLSAVQSLETAFIPMMLTLYGMSRDSGLAALGIITGMALPLVLFPSTMVNSIALMLLPAVSKAHNSVSSLKKYGKRAFVFSLVLGITCIIFFQTAGGYIATLLFRVENIGKITRILSLLCPFVFINTTFKSILNAMDKSYNILINNMFCEVICLFFIVFFIPIYGSMAYITGIIISQAVNSALCLLAFGKCIRQYQEVRPHVQ